MHSVVANLFRYKVKILLDKVRRGGYICGVDLFKSNSILIHKKNMIENKQVITVPEGKLRDYIDGVFRKDTPEEYVRQNIEKRLVNEHQYPKGLIKIEFPIKVGSTNKRVDIAIFPNDCTEFTQENIILIIECKKENISPNDKKDGVGQLKSYMQACGNCEWGMWTNGKDKEVYRKCTTDKGKIEFDDYIDIPSYNTPIEEIDRPSRKSNKKQVATTYFMLLKNVIIIFMPLMDLKNK